MVQRARAKQALSALDLRPVTGPDGEPLFDVPDEGCPDPDTPAPSRLLGMWDNVLLAYHDRGRIIPEPLRQHVTRMNGDVLPTLLVDGYVAGVWRAVEGGIEATAFTTLPDETWAELAEEAGALSTLLTDGDPRVYAAFKHWWAKLPAGDVRILPG